MIKGRSYVPAVAIAAALAFAMGVVHLVQIVVHQDLYYLRKFPLGLDYQDFYKASLNILDGQNPYMLERYVAPPVPALINIPLTRLPSEQARLVVMALILGAVLLSYYLMQRKFGLATRDEGWIVLVAGCLIILLSYPFHFLFDRGNIDGFVLLLMCAGLFFVDRQDALAGLLFALAMTTKVYPVLLFIPIVTGRRWRLLIWTLAALAVLVAVAPTLWNSYLAERLMRRSNAFLLAENSSLANTFYFFGQQFSRLPLGEWGRDLHVKLRSFSLVFYALLLGISAILDLLAGRSAVRQNDYARMALYFPFMIAVPQLAYHYELVILIGLIPMVCFLWQEGNTRTQRILLGLMTAGIAISQVQATALAKMANNLGPYYIAGIGLLLVILAVTGYKIVAYLLARTAKRLSIQS